MKNFYHKFYVKMNKNEIKQFKFIYFFIKDLRFNNFKENESRVKNFLREKLSEFKNSELINFKYNDKKTLLDLCVNYKFSSLLKIVLQFGANPNIKNSQNESPLYRRSNLKCVKILLSFNADPNFKGNFGPLLFDYVSFRNLEMVKALVNHGVDLNVLDEHGNNVVNRYYSKFKVIDYLISKGVDPDLPNNDGETAIFKIIKLKHLKQFMKYDVDLNRINKDGKSALEISVEKVHFKKVKILLMYGAGITFKLEYPNIQKTRENFRSSYTGESRELFINSRFEIEKKIYNLFQSYMGEFTLKDKCLTQIEKEGFSLDNLPKSLFKK